MQLDIFLGKIVIEMMLQADLPHATEVVHENTAILKIFQVGYFAEQKTFRIYPEFVSDLQ